MASPGLWRTQFWGIQDFPSPFPKLCRKIASPWKMLTRILLSPPPTPAPGDPQGNPGVLPALSSHPGPATATATAKVTRGARGGQRALTRSFVAAKFKTLYHHKHSFIWAKPSRGAFYYPGLLNKNLPIMRRVDPWGGRGGPALPVISAPGPGLPRSLPVIILPPLPGLASPQAADNRAGIFALDEFSW